MAMAHLPRSHQQVYRSPTPPQLAAVFLHVITGQPAPKRAPPARTERSTSALRTGYAKPS